MLFQYQNFQLPVQYFVRIYTMSAYKPYLFQKELNKCVKIDGFDMIFCVAVQKKSNSSKPL